MSKTVALNGLETVWVTSYATGSQRGTRFDITVQLDEQTQLTATFTVDELADVLRRQPGSAVRGLAKPIFERRQPETPIGMHKHFLGPESNATTICTPEDGLSHCHTYIKGKYWTEVTEGHRHPVSHFREIGPPVVAEGGC